MHITHVFLQAGVESCQGFGVGFSAGFEAACPLRGFVDEGLCHSLVVPAYRIIPAVFEASQVIILTLMVVVVWRG